MQISNKKQNGFYSICRTICFIPRIIRYLEFRMYLPGMLTMMMPRIMTRMMIRMLPRMLIRMLPKLLPRILPRPRLRHRTRRPRLPPPAPSRTAWWRALGAASSPQSRPPIFILHFLVGCSKSGNNKSINIHCWYSYIHNHNTGHETFHNVMTSH